VRIVEANLRERANLLRVARSESSVMVPQESMISLWTVTGERAAKAGSDQRIVDCVITDNALGRRKNVAICLSTGGGLLFFKSVAERSAGDWEEAHRGTGVKQLPDSVPGVQTSNGGEMHWKIFEDSQRSPRSSS
jgi:hypothetical protein